MRRIELFEFSSTSECKNRCFIHAILNHFSNTTYNKDSDNLGAMLSDLIAFALRDVTENGAHIDVSDEKCRNKLQIALKNLFIESLNLIQ